MRTLAGDRYKCVHREAGRDINASVCRQTSDHIASHRCHGSLVTCRKAPQSCDIFMSICDTVTQGFRFATSRDTFRHRRGADWTYPVLSLEHQGAKRRKKPEIETDLPEDGALAIHLKRKLDRLSQMLTTHASVSSYRWELHYDP